MWSVALKIIGGSLLTFAIVWALVLGWWQSNDYEPSQLDLALYLGALPLALVGGYLLLRGFIEHLKAPAVAAKPESAPLLDADPLAASSAKTAAAERAFRVCLVDALLVCAGGTSPDDLLAALEAGQRPEPSFRLTDDAGFPVFLAEVKDLDVDAMLEKVGGEVDPVRELGEHEAIVRALVLLDNLLGAAGERLDPLLQGREAAALHVVWLVPAGWGAPRLAALRTWLQGGYWPEPERSRVRISVLAVGGEADVMRQLDELVLYHARDPSRREVSMLLGSVSAVDESSVENRAAAGQLFSPENQQRKIPGDGAVALIMTGQEYAAQLDLAELISLSRVSMALRDKPANAGGRVSGKLLQQLIAGLLDVSGQAVDRVKAAVFDTDHRASHLAEALEGLGETFAHLDPAQDCLSTGTVAGDLSPIGGLLAVACARSKVLANESAALCISNQHEIERAALLAMPFVAPPATEPRSS